MAASETYVDFIGGMRAAGARDGVFITSEYV